MGDGSRRRKLTPEQYRVLRQKDTEAPFTGQFLHNKAEGVYTCIGCGAVLFRSQHKFDSGSGWPSFYDVAKSGSVELRTDNSHGMSRVEVLCHQCGGHLGHVFDDAPQQPIGKRYCINSCVLDFKPDKTKQSSGN